MTAQTMTIRYADGTETILTAVPLSDDKGGPVSYRGASPDPRDRGAQVTLTGACATTTPDTAGYPETFRPPHLYMAEAVAAGQDVRGMFAQFAGRPGMFGWAVPIAAVTL